MELVPRPRSACYDIVCEGRRTNRTLRRLKVAGRSPLATGHLPSKKTARACATKMARRVPKRLSGPDRTRQLNRRERPKELAVRESLSGSTAATEHDDLRKLIDKALPGGRPQTRDLLAGAARVRSFRGEDTVFRQGEPIPLTLMIRGFGTFRRTTIDGQHLAVGIANPGDLFGFSAIASAHSPVDLVALTDCQAAFWKGPEVRQLAATDSGFALAVVDWMANYLTTITEKVDGFLHQDARRRVVRILARHKDLFFAEPAVLSRSHLPSLVGTSREMTGRVLRQLEREGTLARVGRTGLRLLRPDGLDLERARPSQKAPGSLTT
jgi:CRP-like cAMP-binding protein